MDKVLVTGGAGFIGYHLANKLKEKYFVTIIDNLSRGVMDKEFAMLLNNNKNVEFIHFDMTKDMSSLKDDFKFVYHMAAVNGTKNFYKFPAKVLRTNILSNYELLKWLHPLKTEKIIFASSCEAYANTITRYGNRYNLIPTKEDVFLGVDDVFNPRMSYGASKLIGEMIFINELRNSSIRYNIIRYHNSYGERMGMCHVIPELIYKTIGSLGKIKLYGGYCRRSFQYISDTVRDTIAVMEKGKDKEIYNVGNDTEIWIDDIAEKIKYFLSSEHLSLEEMGSPEGCVDRRIPDLTKFKKDIGIFENVSLDIGLEKTIKWYLERIKNENL